MRLFFGSDIIGNQKIFSITVTATNCTYTGASTIVKDGTASITFTPNSNCQLPSSVTVSGATSSWNSTTGVLSLSSVTGSVSVTVEAVCIVGITVSATNCTYTGDSTVAVGGTAALVFTADQGYELPSSVTVSGATSNWNSTTGALQLSNVTGAVSITVVAQEATPAGGGEIYGVSGMYGTAKALTRTDDAVGKSYTITSSTGEVSSDFNSVFPWNQMTKTTLADEGINSDSTNQFVKVPAMWWRIGKDSSNRITDIAVSDTQGSTGDWYHTDAFYYGAYGASVSSDKLCSTSGVARQHTKTRAEFRAYANANNASGEYKYRQLDLYHRTILTFLWLIEFANKDSQSIMRGRDSSWGGTAAAVNTGGTDSLTTPTGFNPTTKQMRYHYIEDFVGNYYEFLEGSVGNGTAGSTQYVTADPSKFSDSTSGLNALSYNSPASGNGNCVAALGWDSNNPFLVLPKEVVNNSSYNTYFCDYGSTSNNVVLSVGASWVSSAASNGVLRFDRSTASAASNYVGGRLLYKQP